MCVEEALVDLSDPLEFEAFIRELQLIICVENRDFVITDAEVAINIFTELHLSGIEGFKNVGYFIAILLNCFESPTVVLVLDQLDIDDLFRFLCSLLIQREDFSRAIKCN